MSSPSLSPLPSSLVPTWRPPSGPVPAVRQTTWNISFHDRQRLRAVAKRVLLTNGVPPAMVTDYEADKYIDSLGPETYERWIKAAVDRKVA